MNKFDLAMRFVSKWESAETERERAIKEICMRSYWDEIKGDKLSPRIAVVMMDHAAVYGPRRAIQELQGATKIVRDGRIGINTLQAAKRYDQTELAKAIIMTRVVSICSEVRRNTGELLYLAGRIRRTHELLAYILSEVPTKTGGKNEN